MSFHIISPRQQSTRSHRMYLILANNLGDQRAKDNLNLGKKTAVRQLLPNRDIIWSDWVDHIEVLTPVLEDDAVRAILSDDIHSAPIDLDATISTKITRVFIITEQSIVITQSSHDYTLVRKIPFDMIECVLHEPVKSNEGLIAIVLNRRKNSMADMKNKLKSMSEGDDTSPMKTFASPTSFGLLLQDSDDEEEENEEDKNVVSNQLDYLFVTYRKLEFFQYFREATKYYFTQKQRLRDVPILGVTDIRAHLRILKQEKGSRVIQEPKPVQEYNSNPFIFEVAHDKEYYTVTGISAILNWMIRFDDNKILFSDMVKKRTGKGKELPKLLLVTDMAVYLVNPMSLECERRILLCDIESILLSVSQKSQQQPKKSPINMYDKAHRLSIAVHSQSPNNTNTLSSFALIIPSEYDIHIISERSLEIVGIIRNAQGQSIWLRYDHDITKSGIQLHITPQYRQMLRQRQDVDYVRSYIKQGIVSKSEQVIQRGLEMARQMGLERDFMYTLGSIELSTCREFTFVQSMMRNSIKQCTPNELGEWLMEVYESNSQNGETYGLHLLYEQMLPSYRRIIQLENLIYNVLGPLHGVLLNKFEKQVLFPELQKQLQGKRQAIDRDQVDARFCNYMKEQLDASVKQLIDDEMNRVHETSNDIKPITMQVYLSACLNDAVNAMDVKEIQMLLHMSILFGIIKIDTNSPRALRSSQRKSFKVTDEHFIFHHANRTMIQLEMSQFNKQVNTLGDDVAISELVLQVSLKGSYLSSYGPRGNYRSNDIPISVTVDLFDKLGYHTHGITMRRVLHPPTRDYTIEEHEQLRKSVLTDTPMVATRKKKRMNRYDNHLHGLNQVYQQEQDDCTFDIDLSTCPPCCLSQHTHFVVSVQIHDTNPVQVNKNIVLKLLRKTEIVFDHTSVFSTNDYIDKTVLVCILSRLVTEQITSPNSSPNLTLPVGNKVNWSLCVTGKSVVPQLPVMRTSLGILSPPKRMIVTVLAGRNLAPKDWHGKSDPYCVLFYEGQQFKSKRKTSTLNPTWKGQSFVFTIDPTFHGTLYCTCFDHDTLSSDRFMGEIIIPIISITATEKWYPVQANDKFKEAVSGDIRLKIEFDFDVQF